MAPRLLQFAAGKEGGAGCKAPDRVTIAARARFVAITQFPSLSPIPRSNVDPTT